MKKIIILFLLIFMIPFGVFAENTEYYIGTWEHIVGPLSDGTMFITIFNVFENHKAFYYSAEIDQNHIESSNSSMISWSLKDDRFILEFETGFGIYLKAKDEKTMISAGSFGDLYHRIHGKSVNVPETQKEVSGNLEEGFLLDPGHYIIGEDIPAGNYKFEYYKAPTDIFFRDNPDDSMWSAYASVAKDHPVFAKLTLTEGGRLDIGAYPVIIMYAKPVFPQKNSEIGK